MNNFKYSNKQNGFTLIEVMIAVVVFSFGLLGVAGVMIVSVKSNHNGYMRSQATFLAHSIIDSMRINSFSLWANTYDGTYDSYVDLSGTCTTSACQCNAVANRDTQNWANMIVQTLPNGSGTILCEQLGATPPAGLYNCGDSDEPYMGLCTVTVSWSEANEIDAASAQSITVVAQP